MRRQFTAKPGQIERGIDLPAPCDLRGSRRQDETRKTVDLGHSSDGPSWIDLVENRFKTTESRFAAGLNRLLQQNLPIGDIERFARLKGSSTEAD
jgi:hypothetical protein